MFPTTARKISKVSSNLLIKAKKLLEGVDYKTIVDGNLKMRAAEFRLDQWDPTVTDFSRYGKRYLKKSGMYEYKKIEQTDSDALYKYKGSVLFSRKSHILQLLV